MDNSNDRKVITIPTRSERALNAVAEPVERERTIPVRVGSIPLAAIAPSPFQTREIEEDEELLNLKASIEAHGVIQPIIVRPLPHSSAGFSEASAAQYELVAGERRFRAASMLGIGEIPAIVRELSDQESLELTIIENAQRENLNPVEEALAFRMLATNFHLTQGEIAKAVGKNRATIANSLRLLHLHPHVIEMLKHSELSAGHGRALLMIDEPALQLKVAKRAARKSLSVRMLEAFVSKLLERGDRQDITSEEMEREAQNLSRLESKVSDMLGLPMVRLKADPQGRRRLTLTFDTEASWRRFMSRIREE